MGSMYRGLSTFISDIRACKSKEQEQQRVDKELANVRKAFTSGKMTPYDRKKYVWKLVYINMLGYDVDFGHMEMIALVSAPSYAEKLVGYLSVAVMLRNTDEQITLVVQAIKNDLQSTQDPIQCLALAAIANIGGKELAEAIAPDVQRILFSRSIFPVVRRKAALCLLRLVRIAREILPAEEWSKKLITLLEDKNLGVVLSVTTLLHGLAEKDPSAYEPATGHLLVWLTRLAVHRQVPEDYLYHGIPCPWLQVRILRLLQCFPVPTLDAMRTRLNEVLTRILDRTEVTKSVNRNNAEHCVLFETVNLLIKQGEASDPVLRQKAVTHLSKFINIREPNIRYLGLDTMARMVDMEGVAASIRKQQSTVLFSLKDADISIRRRALDLLFAMCDHSNAESIVNELLQYLAIADSHIKDEMVLKTAILAERFAPDMQWYVDTVLRLMSIAGDFVTDDIWHRVVQIVTNTEDLQKYAASKMYHALEPVSAHETVVKAGAYVLGEFGFLLAEGDVDMGEPVVGAQQFAVLHQHFPRCGSATKALLLTTYAKLCNLYPQLRAQTMPIFEQHTGVLDAELQQRAVEYSNLPGLREDVIAAVLDAMPPFPQRESSLETRLKKATEENGDKDQFAAKGTKEVAAVIDDDDVETARSSRAGSAASIDAVVPSAPPAPAPSAGGLDDLLGLISLGAPAPAPAAAASSSAGGLGGLFGDVLGSSAPSGTTIDAASVPVTNRIGIDSSLSEQVGRWFTTLQSKTSGVLFEDPHVQIGCKRTVAGAKGEITLFFGNKTSVPLVALKVRVPPHAGVKLEPVGDAPSTVQPKAQVQIKFAVESVQPFVDAPALQVSFISNPGTGHAYPLRLPVSALVFSDPIAMPGPDFRQRWTALAGAPKEVTAMVSPASGVGSITMGAAAEALNAVNMATVDAGAPGATGASSVRTTTLAPTGQPISVGCLAMVIPDTGSGVFKCAVRTQHPDVSQSIMTVLQSILQQL